MEYLKLVLVLVHVSSTTVLFGAPLGLVRMTRTALEKSDESFKLAALEAGRRAKLAGIAGLSTLVTGIALIFTIGGFALAPKNFHAALGIMLCAVAFSFAWMRPNTVKLVLASLKDPVDKDAARAALGNLALGGGILQAAWLVNLTLMFYRF